MSFKDKHRQDVEKILDVDAAMAGSLTFRDPVNLRINGKFEGTLETKGSLVIGPNAIVNAHIIGDEIIIAGRIKGDILAKQKLILLPSAVVEIKARTARLVVNEGAVFEGTCHMLKDHFSIDELAKYLEVELPLITEWASTGKVPALKDGESWKFERKAIDEWLAAGRIGNG